MTVLDEMFSGGVEFLKQKFSKVSVDPATAGKLANDLAFAGREFARGSRERVMQEMPSSTCGDALQDEINSKEVLLNRSKQILDDIQQDQRPFRLGLATASARGRLFLQAEIDEREPARIEAQAEVDKHSARLANLVKQRETRDRETPTSTEPELAPRMMVPADGLFYGL